MDALRLPLDIFYDARLRDAAAYADAAPARAVAVWIAALIVAATREGAAPATYAFAVATARVAVEPIGAVEELIAAFRRFGLIGDGRVADWERYAPSGVWLRPADFRVVAEG